MCRVFVPKNEGFEVQPLAADRYRVTVTGGGEPSVVSLGDAAPSRTETLLLRIPGCADGAASAWAVLAGRTARVAVNGESLALGVAVLRHRDELRIEGAGPLYFSDERLARVEPCDREDGPRCPRCAQPIPCGDLAVRCPGCGVLHHQLPQRPCWTHLPRCALCDVPTSLEGDLSWTPEDL